MEYATEKLSAWWAGTACPACGAEKWANSPFCRHCSIRLHRAHMFRNRVIGNFKSFTGHTFEVILRASGGAWGPLFLRWYDRCIDFLGSRRADAA